MSSPDYQTYLVEIDSPVEHRRDKAEIEFASRKVELRYPIYWDAFQDLSTERQLGMTVGPIPRSKVREYAEEAGLTYYEAQVLFYAVQKLDTHFLKKQAEKAKKQQK